MSRPLVVLVFLACAGCGDSSASRPAADRPDAAQAGGSERDAPDPGDVREDTSPPTASGGGSRDAGPSCEATAESETACGDAEDEDCDGFTDCLDPDCEGRSCGEGELTCNAGGCLAPCEGDDCLPALPPLENVVARVRNDT